MVTQRKVERYGRVQVARDDDFLSDTLLAELVQGARLKHHHAGVGGRYIFEEQDKILTIVKRLVVTQTSMSAPRDRVKKAELAFAELDCVQRHMRGKPQREQALFFSHANRYLQAYLPTSTFEFLPTDRYSEHTGKDELCVRATGVYQAGQVISGLCGVLVMLTKEENEAMRGGQDFSIVVNVHTKKIYILLGPARFVNHDCNPNVKMKRDGKSLTFEAVRKIEVGEEILSSYGENYFGESNCECLCATCEDNKDGMYADEDEPEGEEGSGASSETLVNTHSTSPPEPEIDLDIRKTRHGTIFSRPVPQPSDSDEESESGDEEKDETAITVEEVADDLAGARTEQVAVGSDLATAGLALAVEDLQLAVQDADQAVEEAEQSAQERPAAVDPSQSSSREVSRSLTEELGAGVPVLADPSALTSFTETDATTLVDRAHSPAASDLSAPLSPVPSDMYIYEDCGGGKEDTLQALSRLGGTSAEIIRSFNRLGKLDPERSPSPPRSDKCKSKACSDKPDPDAELSEYCLRCGRHFAIFRIDWPMRTGERAPSPVIAGPPVWSRGRQLLEDTPSESREGSVARTGKRKAKDASVDSSARHAKKIRTGRASEPSLAHVAARNAARTASGAKAGHPPRPYKGKVRKPKPAKEEEIEQQFSEDEEERSADEEEQNVEDEEEEDEEEEVEMVPPRLTRSKARRLSTPAEPEPPRRVSQHGRVIRPSLKATPQKSEKAAPRKTVTPPSKGKVPARPQTTTPASEAAPTLSARALRAAARNVSPPPDDSPSPSPEREETPPRVLRSSARHSSPLTPAPPRGGPSHKRQQSGGQQSSSGSSGPSSSKSTRSSAQNSSRVQAGSSTPNAESASSPPKRPRGRPRKYPVEPPEDEPLESPSSPAEAHSDNEEPPAKRPRPSDPADSLPFDPFRSSPSAGRRRAAPMVRHIGVTYLGTKRNTRDLSIMQSAIDKSQDTKYTDVHGIPPPYQFPYASRTPWQNPPRRPMLPTPPRASHPSPSAESHLYGRPYAKPASLTWAPPPPPRELEATPRSPEGPSTASDFYTRSPSSPITRFQPPHADLLLSPCSMQSTFGSDASPSSALRRESDTGVLIGSSDSQSLRDGPVLSESSSDDKRERARAAIEGLDSERPAPPYSVGFANGREKPDRRTTDFTKTSSSDLVRTTGPTPTRMVQSAPTSSVKSHAASSHSVEDNKDPERSMKQLKALEPLLKGVPLKNSTLWLFGPGRAKVVLPASLMPPLTERQPYPDAMLSLGVQHEATPPSPPTSIPPRAPTMPVPEGRVSASTVGDPSPEFVIQAGSERVERADRREASMGDAKHSPDVGWTHSRVAEMRERLLDITEVAAVAGETGAGKSGASKIVTEIVELLNSDDDEASADSAKTAVLGMSASSSLEGRKRTLSGASRTVHFASAATRQAEATPEVEPDVSLTKTKRRESVESTPAKKPRLTADQLLLEENAAKAARESKGVRTRSATRESMDSRSTRARRMSRI